MKSKNLDCITLVQLSCKTWRRFKVIHAKTKSAQEKQGSLRKILRPEEHPKSIYTDNSVDFIGACEELNWNGERCTPRRSETHGIAERVARRVKECTSSA